MFPIDLIPLFSIFWNEYVSACVCVYIYRYVIVIIQSPAGDGRRENDNTDDERVHQSNKESVESET